MKKLVAWKASESVHSRVFLVFARSRDEARYFYTRERGGPYIEVTIDRHPECDYLATAAGIPGCPGIEMLNEQTVLLG